MVVKPLIFWWKNTNLWCCQGGGYVEHAKDFREAYRRWKKGYDIINPVFHRPNDVVVLPEQKQIGVLPWPTPKSISKPTNCLLTELSQ